MTLFSKALETERGASGLLPPADPAEEWRFTHPDEYAKQQAEWHGKMQALLEKYEGEDEIPVGEILLIRETTYQRLREGQIVRLYRPLCTGGERHKTLEEADDD